MADTTSPIHRIFVVACLHGTEAFGLKILAHLIEVGDRRIKTLVGNPAALAKRVRFIDTDLNRSFGSVVQTSHESLLASTIVSEIEAFNPDLIIDLHVSTVSVGKVAIVAQKSPFLDTVASNLSMERLAVMMPELMNKSLVGRFPDKSIALEFGKGLRSDKLAKITAQYISNLLNLRIAKPSPTIESYKVTRTVSKKEIAGLTYANFSFNQQLNGYPFLMGEANYTDIAGFLAQKLT